MTTNESFTEREATVLQKLIRHEVDGARRLPHLDEDYVAVLKDLYFRIGGGEDYWEDYDGRKFW